MSRRQNSKRVSILILESLMIYDTSIKRVNECYYEVFKILFSRRLSLLDAHRYLLMTVIRSD